MRAPPKFSSSEVVRLKSHPTACASLVGEMGTVDGSDYEDGRWIYFVDVYRGFEIGGLTPMRSVFQEADLESTGEFDGLYADQKVETAAIRAVARAVASKQPYLCSAGGICVRTPGIQQLDKKIAESLPRRQVASGCTDPMVDRGCAFAEVFNREMIKHLLKEKADDALR